MPENSHSADLCNYRGIRLLAQGELVQAKREFDRARLLCDKDDRLRISACLNNLACYYKQAGELPQALLTLKQSLDIAKQLFKASPKDKAYRYAVADGLINLCVLQSMSGHHRVSLQLCRKGMALLQEAGAKLGQHENVLIISLYNQAVELLHLKENHKASLIFDKVRRRCSRHEARQLPALLLEDEPRSRRPSVQKRVDSPESKRMGSKMSTISSLRSKSKGGWRDTLMPRENLQVLN